MAYVTLAEINVLGVKNLSLCCVHFPKIYSPTKIYTRILNNIFTVASNLTREPTTRVCVQISNADIFNSSGLPIYREKEIYRSRYILKCNLMLKQGI